MWIPTNLDSSLISLHWLPLLVYDYFVVIVTTIWRTNGTHTRERIMAAAANRNEFIVEPDFITREVVATERMD